MSSARWSRVPLLLGTDLAAHRHPLSIMLASGEHDTGFVRQKTGEMFVGISRSTAKRLRRNAIAALSALAFAATAVTVQVVVRHSQEHKVSAPLSPPESQSKVCDTGAISTTGICPSLPSAKRSLVDQLNASAVSSPDLPVSHVRNPGADSGAAADISTVRRDVVSDFDAADRAEIMQPDLPSRIAAVRSAGFGGAERVLLANAWAPSAIDAQLTNLVAAMSMTASGPHAPSFVASKWTVVQWVSKPSEGGQSMVDDRAYRSRS